MKKRLLVAALAVAGGTGVLLATNASSIVAGRPAPAAVSAPAPAAPAPPAAALTADAGPPASTFQRIARTESAAVVNVNTSKVVTEQRMPDGFQEFFRGFGGGFDQGPQREKRTEMSQGSGFIVDPEGWILTNRHVVDDADKVWVTTSAGRRYSAKVVGRDARTDVALLKITPRETLTVLPLGDSDRAEPGEWVMAVGNPFGLGGNSVSVGVVSFKGRPLDLSEHGTPIEMLQTDAAINPGNSGGPLIDASGRVVGINTLIMTQGVAQSSGVGFAVPINAAKVVLPQLKEKGRVTRGWVGIQIQALDEDLARSLKLHGTDGALVSDVKRNGPADEAGLKPGDVIVSLDGKAVKSSAEVAQAVSALAPGTKVKLGVLRDGSEKTLTAKVGTFPEGQGDEGKGSGSEHGRLGLSLRSLDDERAARLDLPRGTTGALVSGVEAGSPAEEAGLRAGDVIVSADGREVSSPAELAKVLGGDHSVRLRVYRRGGYLFLVVPGGGSAGR